MMILVLHQKWWLLGCGIMAQAIDRNHETARPKSETFTTYAYNPRGVLIQVLKVKERLQKIIIHWFITQKHFKWFFLLCNHNMVLEAILVANTPKQVSSPHIFFCLLCFFVICFHTSCACIIYTYTHA